MQHYFIFPLSFFLSFTALANTGRVAHFSNDSVQVWETTIQPGKNKELAPHRHDHPRVIIALDEGELEVVNNHNDTHILKLVKNKSYFLEKDKPNETHIDINTTDHDIRVIVVELKNE